MGSGRGGSRKEGEWKRGDNFDYCCFPLPIEVIKPHTSYEFSQKQKIRKTEAKVRSIAVFVSIPTLSSRCYQSQTIDPVPKPLFIPNPSLHCISDSIHFPISGYQIF